MLRIMLACAGGMSSSLLVTNMQKAAAKQGIDCIIWATGEFNVRDELGNFDILMLGPQVRFKKAQLIELINNEKIPVEVIDMRAYGTMDGEKVLKDSIDAYNKVNK